MSASKATYHHGDLRAACVRAAMELLDERGETALSLRAVARRAGVSPSAPYRHYADREALVSAVAAVGYRQLAERLAAAHPSPSTAQQLASVATAYVQFALERPALFRIMFGEPCDREAEQEHSKRVRRFLSAMRKDLARMSENAVAGNPSLSHESSSLIGKKPPLVWQGVL